VLGLIPSERVFYSEHDGIDWNVIFLLLGMIVIVGVIKQTGMFDYCRSGRPSALTASRTG
jgi:Na+/H+ antiporter NhaD/arsenite permease-like protein